MKDHRIIPIEKKGMRTYVCDIVLEPDEHPSGEAVWHVYCPALVEQGASTWGKTEEEALANIREVLEMTIESMLEHGETIPTGAEKIQVLEGSRVAVTV